MVSLIRSALAGAVAGAAATWTKTQAEALLQPAAERVLPPPPGAEQMIGADPADHPENMPPSELADRAQHAVTGRHLSDDQREQASAGLHWLMGVGFAAGYAALAARVPAIRAGRGTAAGAALFAVSHGSGLPLAGLQPSPARMPRAWWVWEGGSHLVYGAVLDTALTVALKLAPGD